MDYPVNSLSVVGFVYFHVFHCHDLPTAHSGMSDEMVLLKTLEGRTLQSNLKGGEGENGNVGGGTTGLSVNIDVGFGRQACAGGL